MGKEDADRGEVARYSAGMKEGATAGCIQIRMLLDDFEFRNSRLQEVILLIKELVKQIPAADKLIEIKGVRIKNVSGFFAEVGNITRFSSQITTETCGISTG